MDRLVRDFLIGLGVVAIIAAFLFGWFGKDLGSILKNIFLRK